MSLLELRGPHEYVAIARALGLPSDKANDVVYHNPQKALEHASMARKIVLFVENRKFLKGIEIHDSL